MRKIKFINLFLVCWCIVVFSSFCLAEDLDGDGIDDSIPTGEGVIAFEGVNTGGAVSIGEGGNVQPINCPACPSSYQDCEVFEPCESPQQCEVCQQCEQLSPFNDNSLYFVIGLSALCLLLLIIIIWIVVKHKKKTKNSGNVSQDNVRIVQIKQYLRTNMSRYPLTTLKTYLLQHGYSENEINEAYKGLNS